MAWVVGDLKLLFLAVIAAIFSSLLLGNVIVLIHNYCIVYTVYRLEHFCGFADISDITFNHIAGSSYVFKWIRPYLICMTFLLVFSKFSFIHCCVHCCGLQMSHVKLRFSAALCIWSYRFEPVQSLRSSTHARLGLGIKGVDPDTKVGGTGYMSTQREVLEGQTGSHRAKRAKGGAGVLPRKISKTYMANGAIYVIPELYL